MRKIKLLIPLIFINFLLFAQSSNESRLALEYYRNKEYEKAVVYYEKLFNNSNSKSHFSYYIRCLIELENFDQAEKIIKKQIRKSKNDLNYYIDLGYLYKVQGKYDKAEEQYNNVLKKAPPDQHKIIRYSHYFRSKREFDYAEKILLNGRKMLKNSYSFNFELGNLYYYQRNYEKMIDEYLDILLISDVYLQNVQNKLQSAVYHDIDNSVKEILKNNLLLRTQKYPNIQVFNELLIWLYIQEKDFENAYVQAKALDMRNNENGERLIALARMATSNESFDIALEAYEYVINKGKFLEYYYAAKNELLDVLYQRIIKGIDIGYENLVHLENGFKSYINETGKNNETAETIRKLTHLQAFYLNKTNEATKLLEEIIKYQNIYKSALGKCKLELADIYILTENYAEAILVYTQVETDNKNNPVGYDAKFRKARLSYYMGDFEWAQAQLDVLKASTSKLISNDAFELSLLISDNTITDTIDNAMKLFAKANLLTYQNKDSLAIITYDSIINNFPTHTLSDEAFYKKAKIYEHNADYNNAIINLEMLLNDYAYDILGDDALYNLSVIYDKYLNDKDKAKELYKKILVDYPGSIYVVEARKRFRKLRGDVLE
ncbi:MAG: tetratricopeptide repeat protein [Bacteroidales bacterium]|nr:tetratricopeptide repeat protein [Bacteroidales bacterium]